jgi:DNA polymerase-3 subunit gamma/tau
VDEVQALLEQAVYKPVQGRFKVFMIDEVHMLTNTAFNAMLKTLEEPPAYLKFVLATTDPQKVPVTVLSRCLQFNLRPMAPDTVQAHLTQVLASENVPAEPQALRLLARAARGSMRDALSLTDQAIAFGHGQLQEATVRQMLGSVDRSYVFQLVDALARGDGRAVVETSETLRLNGLNAATTLEEMSSVLQRMAVLQAVPGMAVDESDPDAQATARLAALMPADETQLLYSLCLHGRGELGLAPDEYAALTMVLLRLLAFKPAASPAALSAMQPAAQPAAQPAVPPAEKKTLNPAAEVRPVLATPPAFTPAPARVAAPIPAPPAPTSAPATVPMPPVVPVATQPPRPGPSAPAGAPMPPPQQIAPAASPTPAPTLPPVGASAGLAAPVTSPEPAATASVVHAAPPAAEDLLGAQADDNDFWYATVRQLIAAESIGALVRELALQAQLLAREGGVWRLCVERESLNQPTARERLQQALHSAGHAVRLVVEVGPVSDSPARRNAAAATARQRQAEALIQADPFVQAMLRDFGAKIVPGSIKPL